MFFFKDLIIHVKHGAAVLVRPKALLSGAPASLKMVSQQDLIKEKPPAKKSRELLLLCCRDTWELIGPGRPCRRMRKAAHS